MKPQPPCDDELVAPRDWVPLAELPKWIGRTYQIEPDFELKQAIVSGVRHGTLRHRVAIRLRELGPARPKGFKAGTTHTETVVQDWELAAPDWRSGTVCGWVRDGTPERCEVQISWPATEVWMLTSLQVMRFNQKRSKFPTEHSRAHSQQVGEVVAPASKAEFSETNLGAWFRLRAGTWPDKQSFPSEGVDLESANDYFGITINRDLFRRVRLAKTPPDWRKPGPRTPRVR